MATRWRADRGTCSSTKLTLLWGSLLLQPLVDGHLDAEISKTANEPVDGLGLLKGVEVVRTKIVVRHVIPEHVVDGSEHRSGNRHDGLLRTAACPYAVILGTEVGPTPTAARARPAPQLHQVQQVIHVPRRFGRDRPAPSGYRSSFASTQGVKRSSIGAVPLAGRRAAEEDPRLAPRPQRLGPGADHPGHRAPGEDARAPQARGPSARQAGPRAAQPHRDQHQGGAKAARGPGSPLTSASS
jgi:hypothetical protein